MWGEGALLCGISVNEEAPHFVRSDFVPGVIEKSPTKNAGGGSVFLGFFASPTMPVIPKKPTKEVTEGPT